MTAHALICPSCGGPASHDPVDPSTNIRCPWCGTRYERLGAEQALRALRSQIEKWLEQTTGAAASAQGTTSIDVATRSFLFKDRILPDIRRDVRRVLDEEIGDVLGSPIMVPPFLARMPGFTGEDAALVSSRDRILALRELRARLEAPDVTAFVTSAADQLALQKLLVEIDRTMLASNAAWALASSGLRAGAPLVRNNLGRLRESARLSAAETATDPAGAALSRAYEVRSECILGAIDAMVATPPEVDQLDACANRLEETAQWLLTADSRDLRGALASTGVHRDATALRILAAIAKHAATSSLPLLDLLECSGPLAACLEGATRADDAVEIAGVYTMTIAAAACGTPLCAVVDTSWGRVAVEAARQGDERPGQTDVILSPFWVMPARHAKAEGFLLVSGRQVDSIAVVAASSDGESVLLLDPQEPFAQLIQQALAHPVRAPWQVDPVRTGPSAARVIARKSMRASDLKNVVLTDASLVYLPLGVVQFEGSRGRRPVVVGPKGALPIDAEALMARVRAVHQAVVALATRPPA